MSGSTDERVTGVWLTRSAPNAKWIVVDVDSAAADARRGDETVDVGALSADAAETQKLREHAEKMEATARWEHHEREVVRSYADHVEAERDAAVADRDRLAEAAHDLNEYASNKAGYWQHPLTEKVRAYFAALAEREGSDDA
jgi:hypothetical protein